MKDKDTGKAKTVDRALSELVTLSQTIGADAEMVRGAGGNISVKSDDGQYMYIKASGVALKEVREDFGWRRLDLELTREILADPRLRGLNVLEQEEAVFRNLILACRDDMPLEWAPSIESHLHALLGRVVVHLHPAAVCAYGNAKEGPARLERLFGGGKRPALILGYCNPGYTFARKLASAVKRYRREHGGMPEVVFHEKHGVFISAETATAARRRVGQVVRQCESGLPVWKVKAATAARPEVVRRIQLAIRQACHRVRGDYLPVTYRSSAVIDTFCRRSDGRALSRVALAPDEISYAGGPALWVERPDPEAITRQLSGLVEKGMQPASSFIVKGVGLFIAADYDRHETIGEIAEHSMQIRARAARMGGVTGLSARQRAFVEMFEGGSESGHGCGCHPLQNRIAVVTGAGSGLGRSIALGLARAGAMVALADIDENAIVETAGMIAEELEGSHTMVLPCNVTDEASVIGGFEQLVDLWGGLDILVNAAGVAPAYALVDFPVDKWRFALEVNLTGYFLMAREAARIMTAQGMEGSIINLSSKSGLEASKNNTPYNATKAGEIHMARGWAMELGQHGIRVNSVCPGNVFEGSKIWNPEYIRTCARKYGIKPEEVIPYYVNKTTLKKEIKGQDIADAVVFLCSDRARTITGQTLVVDSGQVMVR